MDKLDQFFKDKFENRTFEFKDAYWQEAEKLIEQDRRKKRMLWWWRLSGLLLLLMLVAFGGWWWFDSRQDHKPMGNQSIQQVDTTSEFYQNQMADVRIDSLNDESSNSLDQLQQKNNRNQEAYRGEINNANEINKNQEQINAITKQQTLIGKPPSHFEQKTDIKTQADAPVTIYEKRGRLSDGAYVAQKDSSSMVSNNIPQLAVLPLPFDINYQNTIESLQGLEKRLALEPEGEQKTQRMDLGLFAGTSLYPYPGGNVQRFIGFNGGLDIRYKITPKYHLETGLKFRQRNGTFNKVDETSVFYYSFGRSESNFHLVPDALYYLEVPLGVSRSFGKHKLETGVTTSCLLGIHGALNDVTNPETSNDLIKAERGWIEEDGFKKWHWDLYVEYAFRVSPKWRFMVDFHYTPGSLLDAPVFPGQKVLQESRPVFIDFGVRYKINQISRH